MTRTTKRWNTGRRYRLAYTVVLWLLAAALPGSLFAQEPPWMKNPNVRAVLKLRQEETKGLLSGKPGASLNNLSSTFVANTPDRGVATGAELKKLFRSGGVKYDDIKLHIEYAGAHGNDMVVIMGVEVVVPGKGQRDAGKHVYRRFTDVYRKENGMWRHDLRQSNVVKVE